MKYRHSPGDVGSASPGCAAVTGFGSSDCRCPSHLVRVNNAKQVRELLRRLSPAPRRRVTKKSRLESTLPS